MPQTMHLAVIDSTADSVSWKREPSGLMACVSHAVRDDDGKVWVFDPVDGVELDELVTNLGEVAGVIVLLDRHVRNAPEIAARLGVPLYFPVGKQRQKLPSGTIRYDTHIEGCPFEFIVVRQHDRSWLERAAVLPSRGLLIIAEAVGTVDYYKGGGDLTLAMHPVMRAFPPRVLQGLEPRRLLVGHGMPVEGNPAEALEEAFADARRGIPRMAANMPRMVHVWNSESRHGRGAC